MIGNCLLALFFIALLLCVKVFNFKGLSIALLRDKGEKRRLNKSTSENELNGEKKNLSCLYFEGGIT